MRYLMRISYDGSKFNGFQRLKNQQSVQECLEKTLTKINNSEVLIKGAGRTDALVHALDQCVSFDLKKDFDCDKLKYIVNRLLPPSIAVNQVEKVADDFHARYKVKEKTYLYKISFGPKNPFLADYTYQLSYPLNIKLMKKACKQFIGTHDFHNFVSGYRENYISTIKAFKIYQKDQFLYFEVKATGFYRYMVRSMVGALIMIGSEKRTNNDLKDALEKPNIKKTFLVAPPSGLYLKKIKY